MLPLQSVTSAADGHTIHVRRGGSGEPLLYLHHVLGTVGDEPVLDALAASFDVVAPYLPGWGPAKDDLERVGDGPLDIVLHLVDLLDALGLARVHVAGTSIGAWAAAELAAIMGHRVASLALVNPLGLWVEDAPGADLFAQHPLEPTTALFAEPTGRARHLLGEGAGGGVATLTEAEEAEVVIEELLGLRASARFLWPIPDTGVAGRLGRIKVPTVVATSGGDVVVNEQQGRAWEDGIAGATRTVIGPAGHLAALEAPDAVAALVYGHAARHPIGR